MKKNGKNEKTDSKGLNPRHGGWEAWNFNHSPMFLLFINRYTHKYLIENSFQNGKERKNHENNKKGARKDWTGVMEVGRLRSQSLLYESLYVHLLHSQIYNIKILDKMKNQNKEKQTATLVLMNKNNIIIHLLPHITSKTCEFKWTTTKKSTQLRSKRINSNNTTYNP